MNREVHVRFRERLRGEVPSGDSTVLAGTEHAALVMGVLRSRRGRLLDRWSRFRITGQCIRQRFSRLADE